MTRMNKTFLLIISLLICFPLHAQQVSGRFDNAAISYENDGVSPYAVKFDEGNGISKNKFWDEYKNFFGMTDEYEFEQFSELKDQIGQTHYRFNQYYKGIEITDAQFILHEDRGLIHFANGHLVHNINIEVSPSLSEAAALQSALNQISAEAYMWQKSSNEDFLKKEQNNPAATFYPAGELKLTTGKKKMVGENIKLTYRFDIYAEQPLGRYYVDVDARTGEIINVINRSYDGDVPGSGTTNYNGNVELVIDSFTGGYRLRESGRGNGIQTYDMHSSTNFANATDFEDVDTNFTDPNAFAGVSVHWAIEGAYDYFLFEHGRNSVDGNGFLLRSYVHFGGGWFNAQWDGSRMRFGDGNGLPLVSIDISAHEMTHGVTQFSANLIYRAESGALNESFSDIFGTLVEFYLEGPTADWLIAEDIGAFRSMENPNAYDDPDTYFGQNWASLGGSDNGGVHTNSGVQNFWFYLLSEGGSGINDNGDTYSVTGL